MTASLRRRAPSPPDRAAAGVDGRRAAAAPPRVDPGFAAGRRTPGTARARRPSRSGPSGPRWGYRGLHHVPSASVVKAMLLVAYLRRSGARDRPLGRPARPPRPMITALGERRRQRVSATGRQRRGRGARPPRRHDAFRDPPGRGAGRRSPPPISRGSSCGSTAAPRPPPGYAPRPPRTVVPEQRWGLARRSPHGWTLAFKGGWGPGGRGDVHHQVALLANAGRRVSLAVLTVDSLSPDYGARISAESRAASSTGSAAWCSAEGDPLGGGLPRHRRRPCSARSCWASSARGRGTPSTAPRPPGAGAPGYLALHPGPHPRAAAGRAPGWTSSTSARARASAARWRTSAAHSVRSGCSHLCRRVYIGGRAVDHPRRRRGLGRDPEALALCRCERAPPSSDDGRWARERTGRRAARCSRGSRRGGRGGDPPRARWRASGSRSIRSRRTPIALIARLAAARRPRGRGARVRPPRDRLRRELRIAPSAQTRELVERLRREPAGARVGGGRALPATDRRPAQPRSSAAAPIARIGGRTRPPCARRRRVLAISGEPGIGKSRLRRAGREAFDDGAAVLFGRCHEEADALPAVRRGAARFAPRLGGAGWTPTATTARAAAVRSDGRAARRRRRRAAGGAAARRPALGRRGRRCCCSSTCCRARTAPRCSWSAPTATTELDRAAAARRALADLRRERLVERVRCAGSAPAEVAALIADDGLGADAGRGSPARSTARPTATRSSWWSWRHLSEAPGRETVPEGVRDVVVRRLGRLPSRALAVLPASALRPRVRPRRARAAARSPAGRSGRRPRRGRAASSSARCPAAPGRCGVRPRAHPRRAVRRAAPRPPRAAARRDRRRARPTAGRRDRRDRGPRASRLPRSTAAHGDR